jgi:hypothetical protein
MQTGLLPMTDDQQIALASLADRALGMFTPLEIPYEKFKAAYELPIGEHVEKNYKGLSYLSWPFAFRYFYEHFPGLYVQFEESKNGWPVFGEPGAYILRPFITDGVKRTTALVFPIMDNKHNSIQALDARAISDNCQRATVKTIATFTGLGLKLYSGEDIPKDDSAQSAPTPAPSSSSSAPAEPTTTAFDGRAAGLALANAGVFGLDRQAVIALAKGSLEAMGLKTSADIKSPQQFGLLCQTMMATWAKDNGVKITKTAMAKVLNEMQAAAESGADEAISYINRFTEEKKS